MYKIDQNFISFVENNPKLVTKRESVRYPGLYVLKYSRKVFYDALWNDVLEECRGLVVDKDWNAVVVPFQKIYNRGENGTDFPLDADVTTVRKINGFMGAVTSIDGYGNVVSTTGSLDSDFAILAEKHLKWLNIAPGRTYLFEICDPADPHIIPEKTGAYLIGVRNVTTGELESEKTLDYIGLTTGWMRPERKECLFADVVNEVKTVKHEGFVVRMGEKSLKIKSPYYLTSKLFARINRERLCTSWLMDNKQKMDEEYYPLIDHINENRIAFSEKTEQDRLIFIREFLNT